MPQINHPGASAGLSAPDRAGRQPTRSGDPVVETASGKVRGLTGEGVHSFKGIPYGASTAGRNRFMPPRKPEPWAGIWEAIALAGRSPQLKATTQRPELATVWGPIDELPVGEDCLTLHVWTPGLDSTSRPVMVWFHGGAFSYGSANVPRFDGTNLARRNDVVVVTVNHRLNVFGHLYLAEIGGDAFADSGNAGVLDLVASLEWVRDNIDRFGGDPNNVTIFGQSGGGGKVSTLLTMPAARGHFHRAVIQSGAGIRMAERERSTRLAEAILRQLGLTARELDKLQATPIERLLAAVAPAEQTLAPVKYPLLDRYPLGPVVDGSTLPHHPFDPDAPAISEEIPLLIGDTKDEMAIFLAPDEKIWDRALSEEELHSRVRSLAGERAEGLIDTYRRLHPKVNPAELLIAILTDSNFRSRSLMLAERKSVRGKAPVYMYSLEWETPVHGGRLKAPHSLDTPLVFDTVDRTGPSTSGPEAAQVASSMSRAWATFARTGEPGCPDLPSWPRFTSENRAVLAFDRESSIDTIGNDDPRFTWAKIAENG